MKRTRVIFILALLGACASGPPLPVAQAVCMRLPQETDMEAAYAQRKAVEALQSWGYRTADDGCDVEIKYERFGSFQAEVVRGGFWGRSRDGYWSQEGVVTVTHKGAVVLQDYSVALRGYSTKQSLLDDLGYKAPLPITWLYRPPGTSSGPPAATPKPAAQALTQPAATTAPKAPVPVGESSFAVERMAEAKACSVTPRAMLVAKGAGFEAYTLACSSGDALQVRCEFGNCRVLK